MSRMNSMSVLAMSCASFKSWRTWLKARESEQAWGAEYAGFERRTDSERINGIWKEDMQWLACR